MSALKYLWIKGIKLSNNIIINSYLYEILQQYYNKIVLYSNSYKLIMLHSEWRLHSNYYD